jgi:hypothetical protein
MNVKLLKMPNNIVDAVKGKLYVWKIKIVKKDNKFLLYKGKKKLGKSVDFKNAKILKRNFLLKEFKKLYIKTYNKQKPYFN